MYRISSLQDIVSGVCMSERRRRNRIQGGWSKPASRERGCTDDRQAGFEETEQKTPHGQTLGNQPLVYEDPRQVRMFTKYLMTEMSLSEMFVRYGIDYYFIYPRPRVISINTYKCAVYSLCVL